MNKIAILKWTSIFLISTQLQNSMAGVFSITNRNYGNVSSNTTLVNEIDTAFNLLETNINSQLSQFDTTSYLQGVANSTPLSSAGNTHDHASRFRYFYLSVAGGAAADLPGGFNSTMTADNLKGLSGSYQMTLGFNATVFHIPRFSVIEPERLKIYFGIASQKLSQNKINLDFSAYSLMFQYRFFPHYSFAYGLFKWNGVYVTTGFKYTKLKILYTESFNEKVTQNLTGGAVLNMNMANTVSLGAETSATTIPIDVSSSIGFFYIFDLYLGIGSDINSGSAKSIISAPGKVTATESTNLMGTMSGDINFDLGEKANTQTFVTRSFIGAAIDFRICSVGLQYTKSASNSTQALSLQLTAQF